MIPLKTQDIFGGNPSYTFAHLCLRMDSDFMDEGLLDFYEGNLRSSDPKDPKVDGKAYYVGGKSNFVMV